MQMVFVREVVFLMRHGHGHCLGGHSLNKCVIINQFQIRGTIEHYYVGCKIYSPSITIPTIAKTINIAYFISAQWMWDNLSQFSQFDNSPRVLISAGLEATARVEG